MISHVVVIEEGFGAIVEVVGRAVARLDQDAQRQDARLRLRPAEHEITQLLVRAATKRCSSRKHRELAEQQARTAGR